MSKFETIEIFNRFNGLIQAKSVALELIGCFLFIFILMIESTEFFFS